MPSLHFFLLSPPSRLRLFAATLWYSELIDYFTANKNLDILSSEGTRFDFIVRTYLELWDPEIFERSVQNKDSMMYTGYDVGYKVLQPVENREKFFKALFSDEPKFRLKMCGYYSLDIRGAATSRSGYAYPQNCKDYILGMKR